MRIFKKLLIGGVLVFMIALITACGGCANEHSKRKPDFPTEHEKNRNQITTLMARYKTVDDVELYCEIDLPRGNGPFPVVLYAHSWSGNLNQLKGCSRYMARRGVAGVRINYRKLSEGTLFFDAKKDIEDAIDFIKQNAEKYEFDMNRFALAGASAGAVLTSLIAQQTPQCKSFIAFNGGFDLVQKNDSSFPSEKNLAAMFEQVNEQTLLTASAVYNLRNNPPDTLLLHGTADTTISHRQAQRFAQAIRQKGGTAQVELYEGQEHGFFNYGKPYYDDIMQKVANHLKRVFELN